MPYTYFADQKLRDGNLRAKYDVILFPHVGGSSASQVNGMARTGKAPLPYKKTAETPNLGFLDSSDDIRGGMGLEGLAELAEFVREGGTLITEGSTAAIFPDYGLIADVTVEQPSQLFVRGSILRGRLADRVEEALAAQVHLRADERGRSGERVVEPVLREDLERLAAREHDGRAVVAEDVDPRCRGHGRRVHVLDARQARRTEERRAALRIDAGEHALVVLQEAQPPVEQYR